MKTIRVLSIGNSFIQDPHRYLTALAKTYGVKIKCVNLMIGGCTLRTHYLNMLNDARNYSLEINGESTGFRTSISEALASDDFDVVTLQQASHFSTKRESYTPYAEELAATVRRYCPHAKLLIQQTWAYEQGSERLTKQMGYELPEQMFRDIKACYDQMAKDIHADGLIPSGTAMLALSKMGEKVHRDTFHASLGLGRYLLSLVWFGALTGIDVSGDTFAELDEPITVFEREHAIEAACEALTQYGYLL